MIAPLPYEERLHMLTSYVWADMLDVQMDKEFAFGKVLSTASQAVLIHRVADINYGKEVFRSAPLHTRVRFVELPQPAHTAVLTVSSPEAQDLLLNFGGSVNPLPGYKPWTGDALRLELFDDHAEPPPPSWTEHVSIEIMSPGTTSSFGLKVLAKATADGKLEDVAKLGAMVEAVDPELGGIGGWFRLTFPGGMLAHAGDFFLTEDIDECAAPELNECETFEDGGECTNTDGGYTCSCRDNFLLVKGQCVQSKWDGGAPQTILAYPQDRLATGWRVNEVRVFEKYDERTKTCFGRCPDGSMSPDCTYGQRIGPGVSSAGCINNVRASDPYPGHYKDFLADGDMSSSWWSRELVVDRAAGTGAWIAFEAESDPQCVRLEMPSCEGHMPEVMVIHKGTGKITEESLSFKSDALPFPRPGWTESRLHAVKPGVTSVDLGIQCGTEGQFFGELLVEYTKVPSACQCKQLCLDHIDEGCEMWKWYAETAHCYLQQDVFVGTSTGPDALKDPRARPQGGPVPHVRGLVAPRLLEELARVGHRRYGAGDHAGRPEGALQPHGEGARVPGGRQGPGPPAHQDRA